MQILTVKDIQNKIKTLEIIEREKNRNEKLRIFTDSKERARSIVVLKDNWCGASQELNDLRLVKAFLLLFLPSVLGSHGGPSNEREDSGFVLLANRK